MMRLILGDELHLIEKHDVNRFVLSKGSIECVEMLICFDEVVVPRGMLELAVQCATRNRLILKTPPRLLLSDSKERQRQWLSLIILASSDISIRGWSDLSRVDNRLRIRRFLKTCE
ncbi:hypothetical protein Tcan_00212 [Toxocara canis]|uniref:Uncharacterized protein n=1 Tax=Toxocara canis TaxID=6265 RepID=A0A0B2V9G3_TOXCA|nr:hypothetical protein Tcan_00212 [Toxocara canis]